MSRRPSVSPAWRAQDRPARSLRWARSTSTKSQIAARGPCTTCVSRTTTTRARATAAHESARNPMRLPETEVRARAIERTRGTRTGPPTRQRGTADGLTGRPPKSRSLHAHLPRTHRRKKLSFPTAKKLTRMLPVFSGMASVSIRLPLMTKSRLGRRNAV